jgi:23S rRNA (guanosine2251-2'-O)-methyltransferase
MKEEFIFGMHAVEAAIKYEPESVTTLFIDKYRKDEKIKNLMQLANDNNVVVVREHKQKLERMAGGSNRHQGVVAVYQNNIKIYSEAEISKIVKDAGNDCLVLILDGVKDPHNLGACFRSADASNVDMIIVPKNRAVGLTSTVKKVACGGAENVPFVQVTNLSRTMKKLQDDGLWLVGAAGEAEKELYDIDFKGPMGILLGAEEDGLRRLTREHCDFLAKIPMLGTVESLNVSVSAGIFLFEALRQRKQK